MTFSPKKCIAVIAIFFSLQVSAQNAVVKKASNGKLEYSYNKMLDKNTAQYNVKIIYKSDQVIYKEEMDSIVLNNIAALNDFKASLQKTIESLADNNASLYIEKPTYSLFKFDKSVVGIFVSISNPSGSIVASNTKAQAINLLNWLNSIDFGKD